MDIGYSREAFLSFAERVGIRGSPGVGLHRFTFNFTVATAARNRQVGFFELLQLHGHLTLDGLPIGDLLPVGTATMGTATTARHDMSLALCLDIEPRRLDRVNLALAGRPVAFELMLVALVSGPNGVQTESGSGRIVVGREAWVEALDSAQFGRTLTTEIVVPQGAEGLGRGVEALSEALRKRYGDEARLAVGHCRIAMDEAGLDRKGLNVQFPKKLEELTFDERLKLLRLAAFAFFSPPQHSLTSDYTEPEARLATGLTALLLEYEARRRG